jgi:hypothetical protein
MYPAAQNGLWKEKMALKNSKRNSYKKLMRRINIKPYVVFLAQT